MTNWILNTLPFVIVAFVVGLFLGYALRSGRHVRLYSILYFMGAAVPLVAGLWAVIQSLQVKDTSLRIGVFSLGVAVASLGLVILYNYDGAKRMRKIEEKLDQLVQRTDDDRNQSVLSLLYRLARKLFN